VGGGVKKIRDKTYGQQSDGVDGESICVGVAHLCGDYDRDRESGAREGEVVVVKKSRRDIFPD